MQTLMHVEEPVGGPVRSLWRAAHRPVEGVSRRVQLLGYAVPFTALPAALWRLPIVFDGEFGIGERVYVVALSVVSEALAFAAVGLVAWWGKCFRGGFRFCVGGGFPLPWASCLLPSGPPFLRFCSPS